MDNTSGVSEFVMYNTSVLMFSISLIPCMLFVYINMAMLFTVWSKVSFRNTSRYILFGNMLFADSLQLIWSLFTYALYFLKLYMSNGACALVLTVANVSTRISPLNLAVMALERYSAICFPLRHAMISTASRTSAAIGLVWVFGSMHALADFFLFLTIGPPFATNQPYCWRSQIFEHKVYVDNSNIFTSVYFVSSGGIIVFTYVAIMVEVHSLSTNKESAKKARNTVLLHLLQLGLCLTSFLVVIVNAHLSTLNFATAYITKYAVFIILVILPRCLSPLIYGLRDDGFRPIFVYNFTLRLHRYKVTPVAT